MSEIRILADKVTAAFQRSLLGEASFGTKLLHLDACEKGTEWCCSRLYFLSPTSPCSSFSLRVTFSLAVEEYRHSLILKTMVAVSWLRQKAKQWKGHEAEFPLPDGFLSRKVSASTRCVYRAGEEACLHQLLFLTLNLATSRSVSSSSKNDTFI